MQAELITYLSDSTAVSLAKAVLYSRGCMLTRLHPQCVIVLTNIFDFTTYCEFILATLPGSVHDLPNMMSMTR
jgi:hypothetical protein